MAEDMNVVGLRQQHGRIRAMFERVEDAAQRDQRLQAFEQPRRFLAVHETAEETVVHPSARRHGEAVIVDARLAEEHDAKEVLAHAESEEREKIPAAPRAPGELGDGDHGQV